MYSDSMNVKLDPDSTVYLGGRDLRCIIITLLMCSGKSLGEAHDLSIDIEDLVESRWSK